jgi:LysR family hydrogen peroxide-inducible transcriptional activator
MVAMGLGVTLMPALACTASMPGGASVALKPLAKPGASRIVGLVWRRRSPLAYTMERLAETLAAKLPPGMRAVK